MTGIRRLVIAAAVACCAPAAAQRPDVAHHEAIFDWRVTGRTASDAADAAAMTAGFSAFGRQFDLKLERNAHLSRGSRKMSREAVAFTGALRGRPGSWARIVMTAEQLPAGIIWDGEALYGIEMSDDGSQPEIFRAADVIVPAGTMSCGMHDPAATTAAAMFAELATQGPEIARATGATLNLDLGLVADAQFSAQHADAATAMLIRANNVDGIFSEQIGVRLTVRQTDVYADADSDPFTGTSDAETLLGEVAAYRGHNELQDAQGLTHLFTGRNLGGSTVGIAYIGSVCGHRIASDPQGRSFAVGLTQANFGPGAALLESLIAAHEIGHNFGAPHDGEPGICAAAPSGYIMSPSLSAAAESFSQCSIDVITADLPSATCLSPIENVDVAITGNSSVSAPLTETEFRYLVTVSNYGIDTARETRVDLDFDPALTVVAATPQTGSCGPMQSELSCTLDDIPGTGSRTIDITLRADMAGEVAVGGAVTNAADTTSDNDTFADIVSIAPASDLALIAEPQNLELDERSTLVAILQNRSGLAANDVVLQGTYSAGLLVSGAVLADAACTVDGDSRTLRCDVTAIDAFSSGELSITLNGVETGSQSLSLSVSAAEADPDLANNLADIALEVAGNTPPQPDQPTAQADGGGGSLTPISLLALLVAWLRRRRFARRVNANFS